MSLHNLFFLNTIKVIESKLSKATENSIRVGRADFEFQAEIFRIHMKNS
jgi:hypothetical protein